MVKLYRLENITKHKLKIIKQFTESLAEARAKSWESASIEAEIKHTK